jgi:hypothetical protein
LFSCIKITVGTSQITLEGRIPRDDPRYKGPMINLSSPYLSKGRCIFTG